MSFGLKAEVTALGPLVYMGLGHAQIGEQEPYRLGTHRRAAVGVEAELAWLDLLLLAGAGDEAGSQLRTLARCHHPLSSGRSTRPFSQS